MVFIRFTAYIAYLADYYIIIITAYMASAPSISIWLCIGSIQTRACFIYQTSGSLTMLLYLLPTTKVRKAGSDMSLHHAFIMIFPTEPHGEFQSQSAGYDVLLVIRNKS